MGSEHHTPASLPQRVDLWLARAEGDVEFRAALRKIALRIDFDFGDFRRSLELPAALPATAQKVHIALAAEPELWQHVLVPQPDLGYHSFTALERLVPGFHIEADPADVARTLHALERLLEIGRGDVVRDAAPAADLDRVTGRYQTVHAGGTTARVYHEHAGSGTPLVMLHTAGADSRQYLDLITRTDIVEHWSCHAFDMPLHGRSSSPEGWEWGEYKLAMDEYVSWCLAFIEQVIGRPAVVMGCSMGAGIAVALAASGSPWVRGIVALEAPDRAPGRLNPYLSHPCVDGADYAAAYVRGLMSPASPVADRRHASWIYAQGGPGIYPGDLWFYSEEYDGMALAPQIDTERCPVWLLTGAYDYSAPPESTERLQAAIPGACFTLMPDLGHFPMTENPIRFYRYLGPVLADLEQTLASGTAGSQPSQEPPQ